MISELLKRAVCPALGVPDHRESGWARTGRRPLACSAIAGFATPSETRRRHESREYASYREMHEQSRLPAQDVEPYSGIVNCELLRELRDY